MGAKIARFLIRNLIRLLVHVEVYGFENVPGTGAFIVAANHIGRLEVALVYDLLDRSDVILLVAEKYRRSAVWRWFVRQLNAVFIDRYAADFAALRVTLQRLRQGGVLVMAPEGTRSPTGALMPGRSGASFLAAKSGLPVVPEGVTGTEDQRVLNQLSHFRRSRVVVRIGAPFTLPPLHGGGREAALQAYTNEIMCRIAALLPPEYRGVYASHPRLEELLQPTQAVESVPAPTE